MAESAAGPADEGSRTARSEAVSDALPSGRGVGPAGTAGTVRVRVVARVRPPLAVEVAGPHRGQTCAEVAGATVTLGKSMFTFDCAFGPEAGQEEVFEACVQPLVDAAFEGINGTLLAYGQTGSGKTYTMGTSGLVAVPEGALPRAIRAVFARARERAVDGGASSIRVCYFEIFTDAKRNSEEIRDLLNPGSARVLAAIRKDADGQVRLDGVEEYSVLTEQEALHLLAAGSAARATAATRMNDCSSRSHAMFTVEVVQRRLVGGLPSTLTARLQFVDLAGSEKVKLSGVEGEQLSQAINVNHGLFVLGKVITALTEGHPHVPFRESKLTRILQNSLGGNSRTCMVACVSPSDANLADSISTLTYAAKAKEIRNKPVVNRGASCPNCVALQARIEALESKENLSSTFGVRSLCFQRGDRDPRVQELEKDNANLRRQSLRLLQELEAREDEGAARSTPGATSRKGPGVAALDDLGDDPLTVPQECTHPGSAEARAARFEALFRRCSERLAALQQTVREQHLAVEESLLATMDPASDLEDPLEEAAADLEELGGHAGLAWLDQEARRKQRLLLQVEANHHAMAVLEAQAHERLRQHEAARDLAERELARLQTELDAARSREEQLASIQERYDQRLAALEERNTALRREQAEMRRLRAIQQQQQTRLKVLQDSVRQVTEERDHLRSQLEEEVRRRREQEVRGRRQRASAQERIRALSERVAALEGTSTPSRASSRPSWGGSTPMLRSPTPRTGPAGAWVGTGNSGPSRPPPLTTPPRLVPVTDEACAPWEQLLQGAADRRMRERRLARARDRQEQMEAQLLGVASRHERRALERELDASVAAGHHRSNEALAGASAEDVAALAAALEYQREQVWVCQRELEACPTEDLRRAAARLAEGLSSEQLLAGLGWLCLEAARLREAVALATETQETAEAELAACRTELQASRQHAAEQEQAFDAARSDYECRVTYLLRSLQEGGQVSCKDALGEEAITLLHRRVAELEDTLNRERQESKDQGKRRVEQDLDLITRYRERESEVAKLQRQLKDTTAQLERAGQRAAKREASLLQKVERLESQEARSGSGTSGAGMARSEMPWGLDLLDEVWQSSGLQEEVRQDLLGGLKADIQAFCEQRLQHHLEWRRELEAKVEALRRQLSALEELLGEAGDELPADLSLLEAGRQLENSVASLSRLRDERAVEVTLLATRIQELHKRLFESPADPRPPSPDDQHALRSDVVEDLRKRLGALEALECERRAALSARLARLEELWAQVGLRVPEELEPQELACLQGSAPLSEACLAYLDARCLRFAAWREELLQEAGQVWANLDSWRRHLRALDVPQPNADYEELPLLRRLEALKAATAEAEQAAVVLAASERLALQEFAISSRLRNVRELVNEMEAADSLLTELHALLRHWPRIKLQRREHLRTCELITAREQLEVEIREFDAEASDPNRFKRRGYSGVEENRRRLDYQRRLRGLDASLSSATSEWLQREGFAFCVGGVEYRGTDLLPPEHTHMYAWTGKQLAQKEAMQASERFQPPERSMSGRGGTGRLSSGSLRERPDPSSPETPVSTPPHTKGEEACLSAKRFTSSGDLTARTPGGALPPQPRALARGASAQPPRKSWRHARNA